MTATVHTPNGLTLTQHHLAPGEDLRLSPGRQEEHALVLISGQVSAALPDGEKAFGRPDPFTTPASGWYLPPETSLVTTAGAGGTHIAVIRGPVTHPGTGSDRVAVLRCPEQEVRGTGSWQRHVTTLLQPPQSVGLLLGETIAADGRWSTYPPHRHQESNPPHESALEEAFAFRVRPATGFGVLLTYEDTVAEAHSTVVVDKTLAAVPRGYHTVAAAAGHDLYYLWAAHGTIDTHFALHTDPNHSWILSHCPPTPARRNRRARQDAGIASLSERNTR
jgi:5-deoxy-glucuronate isomerase